MQINQSFHPNVIVSDHFQEIINQIDINTESLLKNLTLNVDDITQLNTIRYNQINKIEEIRQINVKSLPKFTEDEYEQKWSHIFDDNKLDYTQKVEVIKDNLISIDCILVEDSSLTSNVSLWIMPCFYNKQSLEFLRYYNSHSISSKENILNKINVRSICLSNQIKQQHNDVINDHRNLRLNEIRDFSIKSDKKAKDYCYHFEITQIEPDSFHFFPNITTLNLSKSKLCKLESSTFRNLGNLKLLDLSINQIDGINADNFKGLENLEELNFSRNKLKKLQSLTFEGLTNLKVLNLENNDIAEIELNSFCGLDNLEELLLYKNKLKNLYSFVNLTKLIKLNLKNNQINLDVNSFNGLTNLIELNLSYNKISKIENGVFQCLRNLKILYLDWNRLELNSSSFSGLDSLEELHVCKNTIKQIVTGTFQNLVKLKKLNLGFNQINHIEVSSFCDLKNLVELNLEYNFVSEIESEGFKCLDKLSLLRLNGNSIAIDCKIDQKPDFYKLLTQNSNHCKINV